MSFNCITARRRSGACTELKGNVGLYCVFVDEPGHSWDGSEKAELRKIRKSVSDLIITEAAKDGVGIRFTNFEDTLAFSVPITNDNWEDLRKKLAEKHGYSSVDYYNESVRKKHSLACSAILFFIDNDDRSFASSCNDENRPSRSAECAVVFGANQGTILHELLHLFGAADLYYPEKVNDLSSKLFPNSVMRGSGNLGIDDLTRYLIGWRSSLTPDAKRIVDIGVFPSKDAFYKELDKQWVSKAYAVLKGDNGTYYGPLRRGLYNGKGKYVHNSGAVYEGDFVSGTFTGKGKLTYSNGSVYEGEFRDWKCVGHGKLTFSDGSYYEGEFSGGPYPVRGRLRYSTGRVYEGEFDGSGSPVEKRSGGSSAEQKRLTLSDGSIYDGDIVNGVPEGKGKLSYSNGSVYEGRFKNGKPEGFGRLIKKDGTMYAGEFRGGIPEGRGMLRHCSGWIYEGEFRQGMMTGNGVFRDERGKIHRIRVEGSKIILLD